jgi:ComF family protein
MPQGAYGALRGAACGLLNLLFPAQCRLCNSPLTNFSRIPVCPACLSAPEPLQTEYWCAACRMPFVSRAPLDASGRCTLCRLGVQGFDAVYSYGSYEGALRELVHLFKYERVTPLAKPFGEWLAVALPRELSFDAIVPMPLHWLRRWRRGFNQSELLAAEIARRWSVPVRKVVRRRKATEAQAGLTNAKRRANVQGAFAMVRGQRVDGMRVLLVDDVITTGATAAACARVLKRAGAQHVSLLALARTDRRLYVDEFSSLKAADAAASLKSAAIAAGSPPL